MTAVAYLRRSSDRNGGSESYEAQKAAVLELATRNGDPEPELIVEWGRSGADAGSTGRGGRHKAWPQLRQRIREGELTALYSYSLSRLARSTRELLDVIEECDQAGVHVVLAKEGVVTGNNASGKLYLTVLGAVATFEAEVAAERVRDAHAAKRARGEVVWRLPYGQRIGADGKPEPDPEAVAVIRKAKELLAEQGTLRGTARELNRLGIASPNGKAWNGESVGLITNSDDEGNRLSPRKRTGRAGRRGPVRALSKLLHCAACGRLLSPQAHRFKKGDYYSWVCLGSRTAPDHPKPNGRGEPILLPLLQSEAARMQVPVDRVAVAEAAQEELEQLDEREQRLMEAVEAGLWSLTEIGSRLDAIHANRRQVEARTVGADVPQEVDWSWEPAALNDVLHALWERVDVDLAACTIEVTWRVSSLCRS